MTDAVLTLNAGSSSLKFALFEIDGAALSPVLDGAVEGIGDTPHFIAHGPGGVLLGDTHWPADADHEALLGSLLDWIDAHLGDDRLIAVGHRVVHGGAGYAAPVRVEDDVLAALDALSPLAPLHQPHNLAAIRAVAAVRPNLPQVACFDTSFHHTMPAIATRFALPRSFADEGVRRYGFHGLSYEFIARRLAETSPKLAAGRVIAAHLGNGASLCAMQAGRSIDTTMGFTALDGLMMGTRSGAIDPGVILFCQQQRQMSAKAVEDLLYRRSGLLGVSGISGDMRVLHASDDPRAQEAIDLFVYRIGRETGALVSALGGLDGFVFTAGIGEHDAAVRAGACARMEWLGVEIDAAANARGDGCISTPASKVEVWVLHTDEEAMIARHTLDLLQKGSNA